MNNKTDISIVIPAYNEEKSVEALYKNIRTTLERMSISFEAIYIDDGSKDKTFDILQKLHEKDNRVKIIKFRKNFGQTAAIDAGFQHAKGTIVISIDADLQNDPNDIPKLLRKLEEGYDVVCGWRYKRMDPTPKRIASFFANLLRRAITGEKIHDSGCSLKAYKRKCLGDLALFGEMHRFIPALLNWHGYKITEIKVGHTERPFGKSKYGMKRLIKGLLDLMFVKFWISYSSRPLYLFGSAGLLLSGIGLLASLYLVIIKIFFGMPIGNRPLLIFAVLFVVVGVQLFIFGILADVLIKIYYGKRGPYYIIEEIVE
ncbi:MAG: glycosyltransferase family 2 protein [Candidatus Omnitrophica bacterium]|nr:glycosyltransferase family 2 protein [Candidatus Omnitrophota bacterium]